MNDLDAKVRSVIMEEIRDRLVLLSLDEGSVTYDFDLVHTGVLDSMEFVELLSALEDRLGFEIRIGEGSIDGVTTVKGLTEAVRASAKSDNG
jgi:acyl carrier protein